MANPFEHFFHQKLKACGFLKLKVQKKLFLHLHQEVEKAVKIEINSSEGQWFPMTSFRKDLLFFAVYKIYKKNYSFSTVYSGVKFLFFYLTKTANSFYYSKINDSSMVRTTAFSSSRFGVRVSVVPNIFTIYP